jgi:hypothetical protein
MLSISLSLCDLPLFIENWYILATLHYKTERWACIRYYGLERLFSVVEYKYDIWFYSWLKCYNGIFISVRLRIPYLYIHTSSFLEIQGICKSTISMRFQAHVSGLTTYIELFYESCRNSHFSLSKSNIWYTLSIMLRYTFAFLVPLIEMDLISVSSHWR